MMLRHLSVGFLAAMTVSGCGLDITERPVPGAKGTGDDSYELVIEFSDAGNLVPNAEVKYDDMTVGTVTDIDLDGWTALVTVGLEESVELPAGARARIGQKSLLGSEYVELLGNADGTKGRLEDGETIPLARTGNHVGTEDLLSTLSIWLNGGGLQHVQTITAELNDAFAGNAESTRSLIDNLNQLIGGLDEQKAQIVDALGSVEQLASRLTDQRQTLGAALDRLPAGLRALNRQRDNLTSALDALDDLSVVGLRVVRTSGRRFATILTDLRPALREINDAAASLPDVLDIAGTVLFPVKAVPNVVKGDFLNAAVTADITTESIARGFVPDTPVEEALGLLMTALQAGDPLTGPLNDVINDVTDDIQIGDTDDTVSNDSPAPNDPTTGNQDGGLLGGLLGSMFGGQ